jgi:broad-specificity NMP kinase
MNANSSATNKNGLYLITGTSGTGKSTVCGTLSRKGIRTIDGDNIAAWINRETGLRPAKSRPTDASWVAKHFWEWNSAKIQALHKEAQKEVIILAGSADHMDVYWPLFRRVFLLELSSEETKKRVLDRETHDYGKGDGQIEAILAWKEELGDLSDRLGAVRVDATQPPEIVAGNILNQL